MVAALALSSCTLARSVGQSETSTGGTETLQITSFEPAFYDPVVGEISIDARVVETRQAPDQTPSGASPIEGSIQMLGESEGTSAARWIEKMDGVVMTCEGWFSAAGASWTCGDQPAPDQGPIVEYQVTCYSDRAPLIMVLSVDDRVDALRFDLSDGTSIVASDPESRGLVALSARGGIAAALAQTADGTVYELQSVLAAAICPRTAVAMPSA